MNKTLMDLIYERIGQLDGGISAVNEVITRKEGEIDELRIDRAARRRQRDELQTAYDTYYKKSD